MDPRVVREGSLRMLETLSWPRPPEGYPTLWEPGQPIGTRSPAEVQRRAAVLNVVVNRVFKCPPAVATGWLMANGLRPEVSEVEWPFIAGWAEDDGRFAARIEALWALEWALGHGNHLEPGKPCSDSLARALPDLRTNEPFASWIVRVPARPRSTEELLTAVDLYYCLHWGVVQAAMTARPSPGAAEPFLVEQRRWALEWLVNLGSNTSTGWEDVDMST